MIAILQCFKLNMLIFIRFNFFMVKSNKIYQFLPLTLTPATAFLCPALFLATQV